MKKLTALSLSIASFLTFTPKTFAAVGGGTLDLCVGGRFTTLCNMGNAGIGPLVSSIILLLFIVAVLLALGFLVYGGIKWITSGGDKGKVDAARGMIVAALVGLVLVFLSYFIINLALQFFGIGSLLNSSFTLPTLVAPR